MGKKKTKNAQNGRSLREGNCTMAFFDCVLCGLPTRLKADDRITLPVRHIACHAKFMLELKRTT